MNIGNMILMPVLADPAWGASFHLGGDRGWWAGGVCSTRTSKFSSFLQEILPT